MGSSARAADLSSPIDRRWERPSVEPEGRMLSRTPPTATTEGGDIAGRGPKRAPGRDADEAGSGRRPAARTQRASDTRAPCRPLTRRRGRATPPRASPGSSSPPVAPRPALAGAPARSPLSAAIRAAWLRGATRPRPCTMRCSARRCRSASRQSRASIESISAAACASSYVGSIASALSAHSRPFAGEPAP